MSALFIEPHTPSSRPSLSGDDTRPATFHCPTCTNATSTDDYWPTQHSLNYGDVYSSKDSIYGVVMDVLNGFNEPISSPSIETKSTTMQSRVSSGLRSSRPCILLQPASMRARSTWVCLMATYRKSRDLRGLPPVFHHFSLAVYPNPVLLDPLGDHVHSIPEWDRFDQWIFAYEYESQRVERKKRWRAVGKRSYYVFGKQAMEHIVSRCHLNSRTWLERCEADPAWAAEQERLVKEHEEMDNLRRGSVDSARSEGSRRTYQDNLNATRSLEGPIPEDEVAAFSALGGNEENTPFPGPSHGADTPGGAYRTKGPGPEHRRGSGISLTSTENVFPTVRVDTPMQTDTRSVRSAAPYRKGRKASGGRRFLNNIMDRVMPSRKNSKE